MFSGRKDLCQSAETCKHTLEDWKVDDLGPGQSFWIVYKAKNQGGAEQGTSWHKLNTFVGK